MNLQKIYTATLLLCLLLLQAVSGQTDSAGETPVAPPVATGTEPVEQFLAGYIAGDRAVQTLLLQYQQTVLSNQATENSAGFNVTLSTGTITIDTNQIKAEPAVSIKFPRLNGASVSATVPVLLTEQQSPAGFAGTSVSAQVELTRGTARQQELALIQAARSVTTAGRAVQKQLLSTEYDFYTELKSLYSGYASLLTAQNDLYEKKIDLETLDVQGYSEQSATYRTTQLEMMTAQRDADEKSRSLMRQISLFEDHCGLEPDTLQPETLPGTETVLAGSGILEQYFTGTPETYTELEQAEWDLYIAQLRQQAETSLTVSAGAGYTYKSTSSAGRDVVDAGVDITALGGTLSAGISVPVTGDQKIPSARLSLSWSPGDMKSKQIQAQQTDLDLQIAALKILDARESYDTNQDDIRQTWSDLLWTRSINAEQYQLYKTLAQDMENWYAAGLITESENRKAQINEQNAFIQCRISDIDLILHDIQTKMLFITEETD